MSGSKPSLYTQIWNGTKPEVPLHRDEKRGIMVLLDAYPATWGHVNVVPKEEVGSWVDLPPHRLMEIIAISQIFARHIMRELTSAKSEPERMLLNIIGYGVAHVHAHVWPTYEQEDSQKIQEQGRPKLTADQVAELSETLAVTPQFLEEAELALSAIRTVES